MTFRSVRLVIPVLLAAVVLVAAPAMGQTERSVLQEVETALAEGDVTALARRSADRVEVTLFGSASMYSRGQAMYVLAEFFREYPPVRAALSDPSRSGGNWFALGQYFYERGEQPLRVFVRLRHKGGRWELREVRIERPAGS